MTLKNVDGGRVEEGIDYQVMTFDDPLLTPVVIDDQ